MNDRIIAELSGKNCIFAYIFCIVSQTLSCPRVPLTPELLLMSLGDRDQTSVFFLLSCNFKGHASTAKNYFAQIIEFFQQARQSDITLRPAVHW